MRKFIIVSVLFLGVVGALAYDGLTGPDSKVQARSAAAIAPRVSMLTPQRGVIKVAVPHVKGTGTFKKYPEPVEYAPGVWGVPMPDGSFHESSEDLNTPAEPTIEGAIAPRTWLIEHRAEAQIMGPGVRSSRDERDACVAAWIKRGGQLTADYDWSIGLRFIGDGKNIRVAEVQALPERWPADFDEEVKNCYLTSFAAISFPSTLVLDRLIEYPLCLYPQTKES